MTRVIEILGSYSLSLKELRDILSYLYTGQMKSWVSLFVSFWRRVYSSMKERVRERERKCICVCVKERGGKEEEDTES